MARSIESRRLRRGAVALLAAVAAACGGGEALFGPSSLGRGATVRGTVEGSATHASNGGDVRAFSGVSGIRVSLVGTNLSTTTNGDGEFVLSGVAGGTVVLEFEGEGVSGRIELRGVSEGLEISITVVISGGTPVVVTRTDDDSDADSDGFEGVVASVGANSLVVDGRTVAVDSSTRVERAGCEIDLSEVRVGDRVEVKGTRGSDGTVLAKRIEVLGDEVEFQGEAEAVTASFVVVDGRRVEIDDCTVIRGDLSPGDQVKVKALRLADGTLIGIVIEVKEDKDDDSDADSDADSDSDSDGSGG